MKYFKDINNKVFAYEDDGSQDHLILDTYIRIFDEEEAIKIANPEKTPEEKQKIINSEMRKYLKDTDWYIIRNTETGISIPEEILNARSQARLSIIE